MYKASSGECVVKRERLVEVVAKINEMLPLEKIQVQKGGGSEGDRK